MYSIASLAFGFEIEAFIMYLSVVDFENALLSIVLALPAPMDFYKIS